jgi:hypothetical protein
MIVWAKNSDDGGRIQGFVVEKDSPGVKIERM